MTRGGPTTTTPPLESPSGRSPRACKVPVLAAGPPAGGGLCAPRWQPLCVCLHTGGQQCLSCASACCQWLPAAPTVPWTHLPACQRSALLRAAATLSASHLRAVAVLHGGHVPCGPACLEPACGRQLAASACPVLPLVALQPDAAAPQCSGCCVPRVQLGQRCCLWEPFCSLRSEFPAAGLIMRDCPLALSFSSFLGALSPDAACGC